MAKQQKLELELDEFSEPSSQLSVRSPKAKVHCVVTAIYPMNDSKGHRYFNCQIADGKTFRLRSVASCLLLSSLSSLAIPKFCQPCEMYDKGPLSARTA